MKKILLYTCLLLIIVPTLGLAQGTFVPNCGQYQSCEYQHLIQLANNIINWVVIMAIPVSALVFAWAGFTYMTTGVWDKKAEAKKMLLHVVWGLVFVLSAWIIVTTITRTLLSQEFRNDVPIDGVK